MDTTNIAILFLAAVSIVALPAFALVRTCKKVRHRRREIASALMIETEGRLSRIMAATQHCGA